MNSKLKTYKLFSLLVSFTLTLLLCTFTNAASGDLDTTFNGNGIRVDGFGNGADQINATALQSDGKIVVAGRSAFGLRFPALVARYNADGSLDNSFNGNGTVSLGNAMATAFAVAIQSDGKIVVAGNINRQYSDFAVVRLNPNGTFDTTFGTNGAVSTSAAPRNDVAYSLAIQNDGKIIAAGTGENPNLSGFFEFVLLRYNSDGSLDNSFGSGGKTTTLFPMSSSARSVVIQPDGKIVAVGSVDNQAGFARYNSNGTLDSSFDGNGTAVIPNFIAYSVALQPDNKIVAAGQTSPGSLDFAVSRLNSDGSPDTTFDGDGLAVAPENFDTYVAYAVTVGTAGKITAVGRGGSTYFTAVRFNPDGSLDTGFGVGSKVSTVFALGSSYANAAVLQPDGKLIIAGYVEHSNSYSDFALARYNIDGSLDTAFGANGKAVNDIGDSLFYTVATTVQTDGKIVTAGFHINYDGVSDNRNFAVLRYNTNGSLDNTFDGDGKVSIGIFDQVDDYATSMVLQPDGKIVVAGYSGSGSFIGYALVRLNQDGSPDNSFNGNGKVFTDVGPNRDYANSVALQSNGKIVVGGVSGSGSTADFSVVRYNSDGSLDTSFNGNGKVITPVGNEGDEAYSVLVQPDGKVVLAGFSIANFNAGFALVRYNSDGTLDNSFGTGGKVITLIGTNTSSAFSAALQPNGKILVGGSAFIANNDFAIARYNSDGTLDSGFGSNGIVTTDINGGEQINALIVQPNGKIIATGYTSPIASGTLDFATVRYNSDGSLDNSWGNNGKVVTDISGVEDRAQAVALDSSGNVIVAGRAGGLSAVVRYKGDSAVLTRKTFFDFDGDGKSDISVFRPSNGAWYIQQSQNGFTGVTFGAGTDQLAPADFDGDGKTDVAVFRDGAWYYLKSSNNSFVGVTFGQAGDLPRPADFDGDGKADINVFRPSNGSWYRLSSSNNSFVGVAFGQNGDKPLIADFDGDGKSDIAVFRPSDGAFYSLNSSNGAFRGTAFGFGTDIPTTGDFDGDGKTDVAVFRPSNGAWYRYNSSNGAFVGIGFGQNGDIPVTGDFDGDGKSDIAVFRPSNGAWYYLNSSNSAFVGVSFGASTDKPIPAAFQ